MSTASGEGGGEQREGRSQAEGEERETGWRLCMSRGVDTIVDGFYMACVFVMLILTVTEVPKSHQHVNESFVYLLKVR